MMLNKYTNGVKNSDAIGNIGIENLKKPYPAIFNKIAANITDPAVGASTWASGNQVWTGHIGVFTANELKKASHNKFWYSLGICISYICVMSVVPVNQKINIIASNIKTDPKRVKRKNLNAE